MPPKGSRKKADNSKDNLVVAQSDPNKIKEILEKAKQRAKAAVGTKSDIPAGDTKKLIALPPPSKRPVPPTDVTEPTREITPKPNPGGKSSGSKAAPPATRVCGKTSPLAPSSAAPSVGSVVEPPAKKAKGCVPEPNVPPRAPGDAVAPEPNVPPTASGDVVAPEPNVPPTAPCHAVAPEPNVPTTAPGDAVAPAADEGVHASMELDSKPSPTSVGASPTYVTPSPRAHEEHHDSGEKQTRGDARRTLDFEAGTARQDWDWGQQKYETWEHGWDAGYKWGQWGQWGWQWDNWKETDVLDSQSAFDTASVFSDDMQHDATRQHVLDALQRGPTSSDVGCELPTPVPTPNELDESDDHDSQPPQAPEVPQTPLPGPNTDLETPEESTPASAESDVKDASENANSPTGNGGVSPEMESWRCDKHGNPLSPSALYMRFYRGIRSITASN